jgi:hypothetical protein
MKKNLVVSVKVVFYEYEHEKCNPPSFFEFRLPLSDTRTYFFLNLKITNYRIMISILNHGWQHCNNKKEVFGV